MNARAGRYPARGFTLVEVVLTTVLAAVLLSALWTLLSMQVKLFDTGQTRTEQSQLARTILKQISDDLHSAVQAPPPMPPVVVAVGLPMIPAAPPATTTTTNSSSSNASNSSASSSSANNNASVSQPNSSPSNSPAAVSAAALPPVPGKPGAVVPPPPGAPGGPPATMGMAQMAQMPTVPTPNMKTMPTVPMPQMAQMPTVPTPAMKTMPSVVPPGAPGGPPGPSPGSQPSSSPPPPPAQNASNSNSNPSGQPANAANQNNNNNGNNNSSNSAAANPPPTPPLPVASDPSVVATTSLRPAGLFGTETQLQIDIRQSTAVRDELDNEVRRPGGPPVTTAAELRTVIYSFEERREPNRPLNEPAMALVRREIDWEEAHPASGQSRAASREPRLGPEAGPLGGLGGADDTAEEIQIHTGIKHDNPPEIAPEVEQFGIRYFDGSAWTNEWDSVARKGLPVAIEVAMQLRNFEAQEQAHPTVEAPVDDSKAKLPKLPIYRLVIHLPRGATPPTTDPNGGSRDVKQPLGADTYGSRP